METTISENLLTYADYLKLQTDEWMELIKGKLFKMSPAPSLKHQDVSRRLVVDIGYFLKSKPCNLYHAPFDVRLPRKGKTADDEIITVVQPDISVICDTSKLDERGCLGAPDWIIEILSPGNNKKDTHDKFELYEESGVSEYWIVHPTEHTIIQYTLQNGKYIGSRPFTDGDFISPTLFPDLKIDVASVFEEK